MRIREWWDYACIAESCQALDVVGIPFAVDSAVLAGFFVEDRLASVGFLAGGDFTFAVKVPDRFAECLYDVGPLFLKGVEDVVYADDIALTAFEGLGDAEKAYNVAVVGVEELAGSGSVDADFIDLCWIGTGVLGGYVSNSGFGNVLLCVSCLTFTWPRTWPKPFCETKYPR